MAHTTIVVFYLLAITGNSCINYYKLFIVEVQYDLVLSWPAFLWGMVYKYEVKVQYGQLYGFVAYTLLISIDFSYLKQL